MSSKTARSAHSCDTGRGSDATSDTLLVTRAQAGDRSAVVELYQRYVNEIFGYVVNQLGTIHEAEDVTSEIFLRFVKSIDGFHGRSSIRTWLYVIARNQLRDRWRAEGRTPRLVALDPSVEAPQAQGLDESLSPEGPGSNSRGSRTTLLGNAILESLPARYRQVLELRVMEGRSIRDTADEMGTSPGNVKVLQHRALKKALAIADELDVSPRPMSAGAQRVLRSEA